MAQRGRPRKVKSVEEVADMGDALATNEAWEEALVEELSPGKSEGKSPGKSEEPERWWKRNKYDDAINLARVLIKAQGKIHGDTANVVAQLVNDLDAKFPES